MVLITGKNRAKRHRPPPVGPCFRRNFISCGVGSGQNQTGLPGPNPKPNPAWLGGWVRWRCALTKKHAFLCVFLHVQPKKHQNGAVFVDIEGFRPCLSKPSDGAPKWALMARLMQKERFKSPQKSLILENQAFFGHFGGHLGQNGHFGHFGQPFPSQGGHAEKKSQLGVCFDQRDRATAIFGRSRTHRKPGKIFYWRGCAKS